jgi:hypothetical protein
MVTVPKEYKFFLKKFILHQFFEFCCHLLAIFLILGFVATKVCSTATTILKQLGSKVDFRCDQAPIVSNV